MLDTRAANFANVILPVVQNLKNFLHFCVFLHVCRILARVFIPNYNGEVIANIYEKRSLSTLMTSVLIICGLSFTRFGLVFSIIIIMVNFSCSAREYVLLRFRCSVPNFIFLPRNESESFAFLLLVNELFLL